MKWRESWQKKFRSGLFIGFVILLVILLCFPLFFAVIEKREGIVLHDRLLSFIPPYDVSIPIFFIIWSMTILIVIRCIQSPSVCLLFLWSYIFLCLSRIVTISLVPLAPPTGLLELKDPLTDIFYGGKFVSRDLFYSGHTATQFLIFLCVPGKKEKLVALCGTIAIAVLLLIQHVHYSIDIIAAPFFAWLVYRAAQWAINIMQKDVNAK